MTARQKRLAIIVGILVAVAAATTPLPSLNRSGRMPR